MSSYESDMKIVDKYSPKMFKSQNSPQIPNYIIFHTQDDLKMRLTTLNEVTRMSLFNKTKLLLNETQGVASGGVVKTEATTNF